ncbi:response regulator [Pandoraea communis]|uniref:Hybrid sensor histidine kinase/response regulator n=1 Tax=Pandoraea communis TaxID=2508297 RepID=A0A5E4Y8Z1_9BURK|nr:response regulator [Pandoraea communis]MDM8358891.1 response regulator [Pandoraea communis]VVE44755.1 hybrid sensor histidine kinase/response regulator [Pandoraea communis]
MRPDLVVTDPMMPNADGLAVARTTRCRWPDMPVLAISASPQIDGFARHVRQLAQRGDLAGLAALCAAPLSI